MNLSNLTTRNIGLDIAYIYGVRGDYYGYRSSCRGDRTGKGVCLCKQETRVDACGGLFQNHRHRASARFSVSILSFHAKLCRVHYWVSVNYDRPCALTLILPISRFM